MAMKENFLDLGITDNFGQTVVHGESELMQLTTSRTGYDDDDVGKN